VLYNPQYNFFSKKFCIAGCTTRIVFKNNFVLRVVQPAMYLKKVLYCGFYNPQCERCRTWNCGLYNPQCIYFLIVLWFV